MIKITMLALSVGPSKPTGYDLTASLYCVGDRSPTEIQTYERLSRSELEQLVDALLDRWRPGWEYSPMGAQPPLWES